MGAKFAFRVMAVNEFTSPVEVPAYLGTEAGGSWCKVDGQSVWVPAWDSPAFLARAQALVDALGARFNGDQRLGYYDMGLYGHWGEWHTLHFYMTVIQGGGKTAIVNTGPPADLGTLNEVWKHFAGDRCQMVRQESEIDSIRVASAAGAASPVPDGSARYSRSVRVMWCSSPQKRNCRRWEQPIA